MATGSESSKHSSVGGTQPMEDLQTKAKIILNRKPLRDQDLLDLLKEVGETRLGDPNIETQLTIHALVVSLLVARQEARDLKRSIGELKTEIDCLTKGIRK